MTFAGVFIDAREWHRIPPSRVIRRREPTGSSLGRTNTNASASSSRLQRPVSASAVPSVTQMAAMDRRPPVNRPPARQQSAGAGAGDEPPPPPYSAEDPEPEATRALQESLAAAAAEQDEIELPEPDQPQHRRANSSSASMMTAQTSLSNSDRRTSGDRPIPGDFPASPAARAGSILSNGPSSSTPAAASSSEVPGGDAPPVDTSNMDEEERRAVEESQLEEAMRASRQAEKERLEYEAAVQASLAQAEEDALRRALQYPGESAAESSGTSGTHNHRERSRSGSEEREPRSGRSSKRSSLHAPSVSSNSSGATVRRTGSFNTNKPLPNPTPSALPPVQEPANKSLMDMLASIDFNAPEIKPIQPQPALAAQRTGGSRGSFSGASGASIEATVSSPQSSSTSWLGTSAASGVGGASAISGVSGSVMSGMSNASGGTATATHSTAPTPMGTTPTQPSYIHHAEPRMKSKNPFLSAEEEDGHDTPTAVLSPGLPPRPPARSPPAPPRSEISDAAQNSYQYHNHSQHGHPEHQYGQYLDPSTAEFDHSHSGSSSPSYSPNWRGDAHGLTINTSPRSGFAPSLSSAGATVAGMTPSTGSHSPSGFPFPVAVPSGIPPDPSRPVSDISPARNLPPIPASRSAESLPQPPPVPPAPNHHAQPPPLPPHPPLPARPPQSANHTPSASFSSRTPSHTSAHSAPSIRSVHSVHSEGPATLDLLKGYDTVFLVDDGALRGEGWEAATHLLASLVESAPEGLDVCFLNSKRIGKTLKERADVEELFAGLMPRDGRSMGLRLDGILGEYIDRLEREGAGIRKLNLIVVTDGGECSAEGTFQWCHLVMAQALLSRLCREDSSR